MIGNTIKYTKLSIFLLCSISSFHNNCIGPTCTVLFTMNICCLGISMNRESVL